MVVFFMRLYYAWSFLQLSIGFGMAQINDASVPLLSDPFGQLTEAEIAKAEGKMNLKFPGDYRTFLIAKNGGVFHDEVKAGSEYTVSHFLGLKTGLAWSDLQELSRTVDDWLPANLLPVAAGPGGDLFCMEVNSSSGSRVIFLRHATLKGIAVADSFRQFCQSVRISEAQIRESRKLPALFQSIEVRDMELFNSMLRNGVDPNSRIEDGESALMRAAWRCRPDMINALIRAGADLELRDGEGKTALFYAASAKSPSTIDLLATTHGARVDARDSEGRTALMIAVPTLSIRTIKKLLESGADPQCKSVDGNTALTVFPSLPPEIVSLLGPSGN